MGLVEGSKEKLWAEAAGWPQGATFGTSNGSIKEYAQVLLSFVRKNVIERGSLDYGLEPTAKLLARETLRLNLQTRVCCAKCCDVCMHSHYALWFSRSKYFFFVDA